MVNVLLLTLYSIILNVKGGNYCSETLTWDSIIASNGGISGLPSESTLTDRVHVTKSEIAKIPTMNGYDEGSWTWQRTNCPHLWTDLTKWEDKFPSQSSGDVTISNGEKIIITACSLPDSHSFDRIVVEAGGMLIFDDSPITLKTGEIRIMGSDDGTLQGQLYMGSETCRLYSTIDITFTGDKSASSTSNSDYTKPSKGLVVDNGIADIHGKQYHPTWTRLARTVSTSSDIIYLQDVTNWEVGQKILITTSVFHDCGDDDYLSSFCPQCYEWQIGNSNYPECADPAAHQNEIFTIKAISTSDATIIQLERSPTYQHFASFEYQVEVALISRRITFWGERTTSSLSTGFGGHTIVKNEHAIGRIRGVRADFMGQLNVLGRYPFHFHFLGAGNNAQISYFQDNMVTDAQFRCYTIHATNSTLVTRNGAYNAYGMCYYLEDAVEEEVTLTYNLAAHIHPIKKAADGGQGQGGEQASQDTDLVVPADTSASGFYIPNAYNTLIGNAASGGWSGFAFPNTPKPLGEFWEDDWIINNPYHRPTLVFDGNTAHSTGFYWEGQGAAIYVGALLYHDATGKMQYDSGRHNRQTYETDSKVQAFMKFTNTKTFLTCKGISHWGDELIITNFEAHDIIQSAQLFGEAAIYKAVAQARTANQPGWSQQIFDRIGRNGFQFYDTHVKIILSHFTFRGYKDSDSIVGSTTVPSDFPDRALVYLDHSDEFLPQGINAVKGLKFEQCDEKAILGLDHCGPWCGKWNRETMAAKIYNVKDYDGSYTLSGRASLMGSFPDWWNVADDCVVKSIWNVWYCPWTPSRDIAFLDMKMDTYNDACREDLVTMFKPPWCNSYNCSCANTVQYTAYTTGYVSQWLGNTGNENRSVGLSGWPGVAGISNNAWYWRQSWWGAVDYFTIGDTGDLHLPRGHFVVLSMRYPSNAQFTVELYSNYKPATAGYLDMADSKATVLTKTEAINDDIYNWKCGAIWGQADGTSESFKGKTGWWRLCDFTDYKTGGVGPAWYWDGTYFYLRVVNLRCYSESYKDDCLTGDRFVYDGVTIYDTTNAYSYRVSVTCPGCTVSKYYNSRTFWTVSDDINTEEFDAVWNYETVEPSPDPTPFPTESPTASPVSGPTDPTYSTPVSPPTPEPVTAPTPQPVTPPTPQPVTPPTPQPVTPTPQPVTSPVAGSCPYKPVFTTKDWSNPWHIAIGITQLCNECGTIDKVEARDTDQPDLWVEGILENWGQYNYKWPEWQNEAHGGPYQGAISFRITNSLGKIITFTNMLESANGAEDNGGSNQVGYGAEQFCATVSIEATFRQNENSNKYWMSTRVLLPDTSDDELWKVEIQDASHGDLWMLGTRASWGYNNFLWKWADFSPEGEYIFFEGPFNYKITTSSAVTIVNEVFADITPNQVETRYIDSAAFSEDDTVAQTGSIIAAVIVGVLCVICIIGWFIWYKRGDKRKNRASFDATNETTGKTVEMNARLSKYNGTAVETPKSPKSTDQAIVADESDEDGIEVVSPVSTGVETTAPEPEIEANEAAIGMSYQVDNGNKEENNEDYEYYYEDENDDGAGGDEEYEYDETEQ